jgi:sec-independent protein translocase protein TatC
VVFICSFLFTIGVLFGYFVIAPFAINFLMGYTLPGVANAPTISSLIVYMVMFTMPAGLIFEMPVVVYFLAKLGLVTAQGMKQYRRHSIIGILALAALLTPPDVVTQFLIGIPLFILYELSIGIARRGEKEYNKDLE